MEKCFCFSSMDKTIFKSNVEYPCEYGVNFVTVYSNLKESAQISYSDFFQHFKRINRRTLYHYCSTETFMSIISNSTLRASNIGKSNDYAEVINCIDIFKNALQLVIGNYKNKYPNDVVFRDFIEKLDTDALIEKSINNESYTYYCVCFSAANDLLSQWRGYADDGAGVAIGFDSAVLDEATDYSNMQFRPIEYNNVNIKYDLHDYIVHHFEKVYKEANGSPAYSAFENVLSMVINSMIYNAIFYKNAGFSEENEWRLVYYPFGNVRNLEIRHKALDMSSHQLYYDRMSDIIRSGSTINGFMRKPMQFDFRNGNLVSFVDFDFRAVLPHFIKEIILGPRNKMDDLDLRLFLIANGLDLSYTKIRHSTLTYR